MAKHTIRDGQQGTDQLRQAHAELDRRVRELDRRAILTPGEQLELADLKKQKLAIKDQMHRVH